MFPNFYANWPCSINARFTVFSGFYAPADYATYVCPWLEAPSLFDVLHQAGCKVSLFYSSHTGYQRFDDYLRPRHLDAIYEAKNMPGKEKYRSVSWGVSETATLAAIQSQLTRHAAKHERFFLTYLPAAPHMPYDSPSKEFEKFDNGLGEIDGNYTGRYKNQLLYMDWIITSMLDTLQQLKLLDHTLVVITDDHGEMVGEDGGTLGHGWNLSPVLSNVPLIILDPRRPGHRLNEVLGSQVDVLPTVLDLLNLPLPAGQFYEGVSLYDQAANRNKTVYLNSHADRAIIRGSRYLLEKRDPSASAPRTDSTEVYEISHHGSKTSFRRVNESADIVDQLDQFDDFQRSLLVHYPKVRKFLNRAPEPSVQAREKRQ